eukprot:975956-Karenia_brevis.AAC.1
MPRCQRCMQRGRGESGVPFAWLIEELLACMWNAATKSRDFWTTASVAPCSGLWACAVPGCMRP